MENNFYKELRRNFLEIFIMTPEERKNHPMFLPITKKPKGLREIV